jgi:hypothetical protein
MAHSLLIGAVPVVPLGSGSVIDVSHTKVDTSAVNAMSGEAANSSGRLRPV